MHIKYPKIRRLGEEDNDGILMGTVHVQEKIDGANAQIWIEDGDIKCGSRTQELTGGFNGFVDYAKSHEGIRKYLEANPKHRLFGEWLVRHTIAYNETVYKKFYLFDVMVLPETFVKSESEDGEEIERSKARQCTWLKIEEVYEIGKEYGIETATLFATYTDPMPDVFQELAGKTVLGEKGEGVVIKNPEFINKWGDRVCAKIVTQEFKEDNGIVFGGNNKTSETYVEMKLVNEAMTMPRINKIMQKIQPLVDKRLGREHTSRIIEVAYHDMFEEELWSFVKKHKKIDFGHLENLAKKKAVRIYHDILDGHISVAYQNHETTNA